MQPCRGSVRVGTRESPAVPANPSVYEIWTLPLTAGALTLSRERFGALGRLVEAREEAARDRASCAFGRQAS